MDMEIAQALSESERGLVVAPAGCGKTRLIAEAIKKDHGRQLILTHTHAGVRSLLNHLKRLKVTPDRFRVSTIDGWSLAYANGFPSFSGWTERQPTGDAWNDLCPAAARTLERKAVRDMLTNSYSGAYVDEYQDCSLGQHALISKLAEVIPCRVLGDPMQAVFWKINKDQNVKWNEVLASFPKITDLSVPWRWKNSGRADLGLWLLAVRNCLEEGRAFDLREGPIDVRFSTDRGSQLKACFDSAQDRHSTVVAIHQWQNQCHYLARFLSNTFSSMEKVDCEDLFTCCQRMDEVRGMERVEELLRLAEKCISKLPSTIKDMPKRISKSTPAKMKRDDLKKVACAFVEAADSDDFDALNRAMTAIDEIDERITYARPEPWIEMRKVLTGYSPDEHGSLFERAWRTRNVARKMGRHVDRRTLSTTLLSKGLEFDHAIVLDAGKMNDVENLYVAMTRGAKSLTILTNSPLIQLERPSYLR